MRFPQRESLPTEWSAGSIHNEDLFIVVFGTLSDKRKTNKLQAFGSPIYCHIFLMNHHQNV